MSGWERAEVDMVDCKVQDERPTSKEKRMADEISPNDNAAEAIMPNETPKKKRAPRRSKEEIAAALAAKKSAKGVRKVASKSPAAIATDVTGSASKASSNSSVSQRAAKSASPVSNSLSLADGFADLIALEEENEKLRKSLAEKLRSENADLRKKLGLA